MTSNAARIFVPVAFFALAIVPLAGFGSAASAQTPPASNDLFKGFQTGSKGPVNIEADSLDVVEKDGQRISTFNGNVTVTRGDSVLKASKVAIFSAGAAKKPADSKPAGAKKDAAATTPAPAAPAPADAAKPADAAAAAPAPATDGLLPGAGSFTRIEASGKVYVSSAGQPGQPPQTATGDTAVVDMIAKLVTLSGNVVLSQGPNVITGDKLTWDMQTGKARVEQKPGARIRGIFTPNSTPGSDKTPAKKP